MIINFNLITWILPRIIMTKLAQEYTYEDQLFSSSHKKYSKDLHNFLYYKFGAHLNPQAKIQETVIKLRKNLG